MGQRVKYRTYDLQNQGYELLRVEDGMYHFRNLDTGDVSVLTKDLMDLLGVVI